MINPKIPIARFILQYIKITKIKIKSRSYRRISIDKGAKVL